MTFTHKGHTFTLRIERDDTMGAPWKEHDGHGVVTGWERRDKKPGERILIEDRGSRRFYDVEASTAIARRDQWGCGEKGHQHATEGERTDCAVRRDFAHPSTSSTTSQDEHQQCRSSTRARPCSPARPSSRS